MARGDVRQAASLLEVAAQRAHDSSVLLRLATVRRSLGDTAGAVKAAAAAVELSPRNSLMCLLLGSLREATGALHAAERAYRAALATAPRDLSFQPAAKKQLDRAKQRVDTMSRWRARLLQWQPGDFGHDLAAQEQRRMRGFRTNILENLEGGPTSPPLFLVPGIQPRKFFDSSEFPGIAEVERETDAIRAEFLALTQSKADILSSRLTGLHASTSGEDRIGQWSMIPLIRNGAVHEEFAARCPRTMAAFRNFDMPRLALISPSLHFSILEPGSRIAPHAGITNARAIAHFPLIVPGDCGIRVGGETRGWKEGEALIFDDMTTHEAWNDSDRIRVVLIADLWRPELSPAERTAITDIMDCEGGAASA